MRKQFVSQNFELRTMNGSRFVLFISKKDSTFFANTKEGVSQLHKMHNDTSEVIKEGQIG